jgi:hypothetical protein
LIRKAGRFSGRVLFGGRPKAGLQISTGGGGRSAVFIAWQNEPEKSFSQGAKNLQRILCGESDSGNSDVMQGESKTQRLWKNLRFYCVNLKIKLQEREDLK